MRDEIRKLRDVWQAGYQRLLDDARDGGVVEVLADAKERRAHPRFRVESPDVRSTDDEPVLVVDMSISGVSFESAHEFFTGRPVALSLASVFSTDAEVLACDPLSNSGADPERHRVRCRFRDEGHGLQFLTLTLELERIERE